MPAVFWAVTGSNVVAAVGVGAYYAATVRKGLFTDIADGEEADAAPADDADAAPADDEDLDSDATADPTD